MNAPEVIRLKRPGDDAVLAKLLNQTLIEHFNHQAVLIRCISSDDHPAKTKAELLQHILATGTDKYDDAKKMVGHDFYEKWDPDFFALKVDVDDSTDIFTEILDDFTHGAIEDRGHLVSIDLVLIYDPEQCEMIPNVYKGESESDLFTYRRPLHKRDALKALIEFN
jgi:hypothetical protein